MHDLDIVILAAGKGTRMRSQLPKVLHTLAGKPMVEHVLATASGLNPSRTHVVIGHGADQLREALAELASSIDDLRASVFHETEPVGVADQPRFLNAAATGRTRLPARDLLAKLLVCVAPDHVRFCPLASSGFRCHCL